MAIKEITSPANETIKAIRALEQRKYRKETGLYRVEGLRSVREGLELNAPLKQLVFGTAVKARQDVREVIGQALAKDVQVMEVSESVLEKLSHKDNPQSVIGVFEQRFAPLETVKPTPSATWVVLEQVRDPGNLGTIIRTIDSVGASGVILLGQCCDPYSIECTRATMGSLFAVPIVQASLDQFKTIKAGFTVLGTTLQPDSVDFRQAPFTKPLMLAMGNEQAGLSAEARALCTGLVKLPMNGRADSLNLSVATGVMLYAALSPWKA